MCAVNLPYAADEPVGCAARVKEIFYTIQSHCVAASIALVRNYVYHKRLAFNIDYHAYMRVGAAVVGGSDGAAVRSSP